MPPTSRVSRPKRAQPVFSCGQKRKPKTTPAPSNATAVAEKFRAARLGARVCPGVRSRKALERKWHVYPMVAAGLAIIYILPRFTKAVPSALVCIIALTIVAMLSGMPLRTVGDMGALPTEFPAFLLPKVPLTFETLRIIFPYSCTLAVVGLLESMMMATIVDDMTDTYSDKNRECTGQGIGSIIAGCFGGMAGCAMIGQSVINVKSGAAAGSRPSSRGFSCSS